MLPTLLEQQHKRDEQIFVAVGLGRWPLDISVSHFLDTANCILEEEDEEDGGYGLVLVIVRCVSSRLGCASVKERDFSSPISKDKFWCSFISGVYCRVGFVVVLVMGCGCGY